MAIYEIDPLHDPRWGDFLQRHPRASIFHTAAWLAALQKTYGYTPVGLTTSSPVVELDNAILFCKVDSWLTGRRLVSLPFSDHCEPLVNDSADLHSLFTALQRKVCNEKLGYFELRPVRHIDTGANLFQNSATFYLHQLDLTADLNTLFRNFHKSSIQRKIRRANREDLVIERGRSARLLETFYRLQTVTRRRHGLPPQSRTWFRNLAEHFGTAMNIRVAYKGTEAIAAILTLQFKDTLVYKYGCSEARFHRLGGVHLLFWDAIQDAKKSGLRCFDLGRSDDNNPGLITFKNRWAAAQSELIYVRYSPVPVQPSTANRKLQISKRIFAHSPNWLLSVIGSVLYRHIELTPRSARTDRRDEDLEQKPRSSPKLELRNPVAACEPGAVVIGGDYQGLGIVRSLGRHGIPVCVIDDEKSIARYSRYTTFAQGVASLRHARETVDALLKLGREKGLNGWVLYPTRDETVAALSQHRRELSDIFRVPTPCWETVKWLWDKRNTYTLAEKLGIPAPRTWYARDEKDLVHLDCRFPVALKPAIKDHFIYATKDKAWRADSLAQLQHLFRQATQFIPPDEIMIQDLIPGDGACQYAYCSFFKDRHSLASLVACRRRQHPHDFGRASTYVETVELPLLEEYAERFLRKLDYYGLVEVEFKRDPRDGQLRLLDVNGRTWGYHTIGRSAGLDFPYLLFADQMKQSVEPARGRAGIRWIRLLTDLPSGVVGVLGGHFDLRTYVRSLFQYHEEAVFSVDDPLPGLAEVTLFPYLFMKRGF